MCTQFKDMKARVAHSTRGSITTKKGPMSSNRALRRAKRMKQSEVLMYIGPFFDQVIFFYYKNVMILSTKKPSIMREKGLIQSLLKKMPKNR